MLADHRRERGRRNRAALVQAALELFTERGFDPTTVDQVAERAGVSPRTFFHHFATKEDVLFDGYAERLADVSRRFRNAPPTRSLWSAVREAAGSVAESILENPARYLERAQLYNRAPTVRSRMLLINEEWIDNVATEIATYLGTDPDRDPRPRLAATLLNGANRVALDLWTKSGGQADLRQLMSECVAHLRPTMQQMEQRDGRGTNSRAS